MPYVKWAAFWENFWNFLVYELILRTLGTLCQGSLNIFRNSYRFVSNFIMRYVVVCKGIEILGDFLLNFLLYFSRDFYLIWVSTLCFIFSNRNTSVTLCIFRQAREHNEQMYYTCMWNCFNPVGTVVSYPWTTPCEHRYHVLEISIYHSQNEVPFKFAAKSCLLFSCTEHCF
jgi:hypothetical protein